MSIKRLSFSTLANSSVPLGIWPVSARINFELKNKQAFKIISVDTRAKLTNFNLDAFVLSFGIYVRSLNAPENQLLRVFPSPSTMGVTLHGGAGVLAHGEMNDKLYWNDYITDGGLIGTISIFGDVVVNNLNLNAMDANVEIALSALVEIYT